jgi:hypothetical protein
MHVLLKPQKCPSPLWKGYPFSIPFHTALSNGEASVTEEAFLSLVIFLGPD